MAGGRCGYKIKKEKEKEGKQGKEGKGKLRTTKFLWTSRPFARSAVSELQWLLHRCKKS